MVFGALWSGDGITIGELGERVALDGSTITGILDRMEKNGYVERRPNAEDRRSAQVYLTEKAKQVGPQINKFADELDASLRKNFSTQDMAVFERVLRDLGETRTN
jgi:DNA-binding MarR family transcriptional regulator